jgi:endonuclease G
MMKTSICVKILFLIACLCQTSAVSQFCSDCEINKAVRSTRLKAADQANAKAEENKEEIISKQFPFGIPKSPANADNERLLFHQEWVALYDDDLLMPVWVAYQLTKAQSSATTAVRQDCFRRDPRLEEAEASLCEDYEEPIFDRGHMLPANDSKRKQTMMDNGFLFSNMAPQHGNFNRKVWQRLESFVHKAAIASNGLYIVTGAVFDKDNNKKRDKDNQASRMAPRDRVAVPTHFFKILIHIRSSGVIDTKSFILPHNNLSSTNNDKYLASMIVAIDDIELVTGIDFFTQMSDEQEEEIEAGRAAGLAGWFTF